MSVTHQNTFIQISHLYTQITKPVFFFKFMAPPLLTSMFKDEQSTFLSSLMLCRVFKSIAAPVDQWSSVEPMAGMCSMLPTPAQDTHGQDK